MTEYLPIDVSGDEPALAQRMRRVQLRQTAILDQLEALVEQAGPDVLLALAEGRVDETLAKLPKPIVRRLVADLAAETILQLARLRLLDAFDALMAARMEDEAC